MKLLPEGEGKGAWWCKGLYKFATNFAHNDINFFIFEHCEGRRVGRERIHVKFEISKCKILSKNLCDKIRIKWLNSLRELSDIKFVKICAKIVKNFLQFFDKKEEGR